MSSLGVDGGTLYYQESGSGQPVLLLHGGALDLRMWEELVSDLEVDHRVVRFDARGHGRSSTPTSSFRQCDDAAELLRHLGIGSAVLVGLSMGAGAATDATLEYPELVNGLVVSGAATNEPTFTDPWMLERQAELSSAQRRADTAGWIEVFIDAFVIGPHRTAADVEPKVLRRCRDMIHHTVTRHVRPEAAAPQAVSGSWERLGEITVPCLAIAGELDADDHLAMVHRFATTVTECREVIIRDAAHVPNMERPAAFAAAVRTLTAAPEPVRARAPRADPPRAGTR